MRKRAASHFAIRAFSACHRLNCSESAIEIERLIIEEMAFFGFEYVTCTAMPKPGQDLLNGVLLNTRPASYVQHYVESNYPSVDPVVTELRHTLHSFSWGDVRRRRELSDKERRIMDEAREFRVRDGLTIPIVTTGALAIVCPCGEKPDLTQDARAAVELISMTGYLALKRVAAEKARGAAYATSPSLTEREREVLQWVLEGKTDDEISIILSISARTVHAHLNSARTKLQSLNRTQAVVDALRIGEIHL